MDLGRVFIIVGLIVMGCGVLISILPKDVSVLGWFGKLPGDIYYSNERTTVWIPITSMLLLSVVISLLSWVFKR